MRLFKTTLPLILAFTMGIVAITSIFVPHHWSDSFRTENTVWFRVIGGITMFIGAYSLLRVHYARVKRAQKGWGYSVVLFVFFAVTFMFGMLNWGPYTYPRISPRVLSGDEAAALSAELAAAAAAEPDKEEVLIGLTFKDEPLTGPTGGRVYIQAPRGATGTRELRDVMNRIVTVKRLRPPATQPAQAGLAVNRDEEKPLLVDIATGEVTDEPISGFLGPFQTRTRAQEGTRWMYEAIQWPAGATQYALLGFFICSAAYRTFRAKTIEAAVLLIAALVVMLGQVPIAQMIWDRIPQASGWLLDVPNMAVKRAIMFGICVGSVGTSLRVLFGIERSYMGRD